MAYMPPEFTRNEEVNVTEIVKNNALKLHGLTIKKENEEMSPNVYLENFYNDFQEGRPMNEITVSYTHLGSAKAEGEDICKHRFGKDRKRPSVRAKLEEAKPIRGGYPKL